MKGFKLQTVLRYRKRLFEEAQKAFLAALEARESLNCARKREEREIDRLCGELGDAKEKDLRLPEILLYEECIVCRKRHLRDLETQLVQVETAVSQTREQMVAARQEQKTLEILKEKRADEARREQRRIENGFLDEVGVIRFGGGE